MFYACKYAIVHASEMKNKEISYLMNEKYVAEQTRLENLRDTFRTEHELQIDLKEAKLALQKSVAEKNFRYCAVLNKKISSLECDLYKAQDVQTTQRSVHELRDIISKLNDDIKNAMENKKFDLCAEIQCELDQMEVELGNRDLSRSVAEDKLKVQEEEMLNISQSLRRDYYMMATVQENINELKE